MQPLNESAIGKAARWRRAGVDLLMPPSCPVSGEPLRKGGALAPAVWSAVNFIDDPACALCSAPFAASHGAGALCGRCIAEPPDYDWARAVFAYNDAGGRLITALKFKDRTDLAPMLGRWLARAAHGYAGPKSLIAPVPLHWRRLAGRRFNQAGLLAQAAGEALDREVAIDALVRLRATPPQKEIASPDARRRNVAGAFGVNAKWRRRLAGADVILVDDVLTTGATLSACARALRRAGASRIGALVLARVVKDGHVAI